MQQVWEAIEGEVEGRWHTAAVMQLPAIVAIASHVGAAVGHMRKIVEHGGPAAGMASGALHWALEEQILLPDVHTENIGLCGAGKPIIIDPGLATQIGPKHFGRIYMDKLRE
jgi:hypothetical protein